MEALVLSCSTGSGHNTAARAVVQALQVRGHHVVMLDPYALVSDELSRKVGNTYIKIAQRTPRLFGAAYSLGCAYRRLPVHSPVYWVNKRMLKVTQTHLQQHRYDVILTTHVFPGEILTYMKVKGIALPKTVFIATDYACIPFTEECKCDRFCIAAESLRSEYIGYGIAPQRLVATGIPVRQEFLNTGEREAALAQLGMSPELHYLLLSGGSIGAGQIGAMLRTLRCFLKCQPSYRLIVICGNNASLLEQLKAAYGAEPQITLLGTTNQMALYLRACDVYLSKPGGLSSTEAAVVGVPLIHLPPIPGCEPLNRQFFSSRGMSIAVDKGTELLNALELLRQKTECEKMRQAQRQYIPQNAAEEICRLSEALVQEKL